MRNFLLIIIISFSLVLRAQNPVIDSLMLLLKNAKHDTVKIDAYLGWGKNIYLQKPDSATILWNKARSMAELNLARFSSSNSQSGECLSFKKLLAHAINNLGFLYMNSGDNLKAMDYFTKSLELKKELGDKEGIANSLMNIAYIYKFLGDVPRALEYNSNALKIMEEIGDLHGVSNLFNNIAAIYDSQGDLQLAFEYYLKGLESAKETDDKRMVAVSLNNIGYVYRSKKEYLRSLEFFQNSQKIYEELGDKFGMAYSLNNIGVNHEQMGDKNKAYEYFYKGLKLREELGDQKGIAKSLHNLGTLLFEKGDLKESYVYAKKCADISQKLGYPENIQIASALLKKIFLKQGKHRDALEMYELEIKMKDSVNNVQNRKASMKNQLKYEYEKKAAADSVKAGEEKKVVQAQLKQEKTQRYSLIVGLLLVAIFAVFMVNRFRVTNKQKKLIEEQKKVVETQKHLVEEKQKEILDSIYYARRIQRALVTNEKYIARNLKKLNS